MFNLELRDLMNENREEHEAILENRKELSKERVLKKRNPYSSYNYKAMKDGNNFHVRDRAGVPTYRSGYPELAIQEALDSLNNGRLKRHEKEKVKLEKQFNSIGATLQVEGYTEVELIGEVTLANSVDDHILENKTKDDDHILVSGGYWNGNRANQATGNGFDFRGLNAGDYLTRIELKNVRIQDVKVHGLYTYFMWSSILFNVAIWNITQDAAHCFSLVDSSMTRCGLTGTQDVGLYLDGGACNTFASLYLGGSAGAAEPAQLYLDGSYVNEFTNIRVDAPLTHGVELTGGAYNNLFQNLHITLITNYPADNSKDALRLDNAATLYNVFNGFYIGRKTTGDTTDWRNGVNEIAADYNVYGNGVIRDCDTATKTGISGNSKFDTNSIIEI